MLQLASQQNPLKVVRELRGWFCISKSVGQVNRFLDSEITRMQGLGLPTGHLSPLKRAAEHEVARHRLYTSQDGDREKVTDEFAMAIVQTTKIDAPLAKRLRMIENSGMVEETRPRKAKTVSRLRLTSGELRTIGRK